MTFPPTKDVFPHGVGCSLQILEVYSDFRGAGLKVFEAGSKTLHETLSASVSNFRQRIEYLIEKK